MYSCRSLSHSVEMAVLHRQSLRRPRWWAAFFYFLQRFSPPPGFVPPSRQRINEWKQDGCPWDSVELWRPNNDDLRTLHNVQFRAHNLPTVPPSRRRDEIAEALRPLDRSAPPWPALKRLASAYMNGIPYEVSKPAVTDLSQFATNQSEVTIYIDEAVGPKATGRPAPSDAWSVPAHTRTHCSRGFRPISGRPETPISYGPH